VRIEEGRAVPTFKGSGEITSLSQADGYFEIPTQVSHIDAGMVVDVTLY
jgi:molybdopterin biosynthesis enzyme